MNFIFCLLAVIITIAAAVIFLGNLIINLVRAIKINKLIKTDPDFVEGKVIEIIKGGAYGSYQRERRKKDP